MSVSRRSVLKGILFSLLPLPAIGNNKVWARCSAYMGPPPLKLAPKIPYETQYHNEFIAGFNEQQSLLRKTIVSETNINRNEAVFLVADSGNKVKLQEK